MDSSTTSNRRTIPREIRLPEAQAQAVLLVPSAPSELSNALELDFGVADQKAIRDRRYKLIVNPYLCEEQFFDLFTDPFEQVELISAGSLTEGQEQAYFALKQELAAVLGS